MSESDSEPNKSLIEPLTSREVEILACLAENRSNREIAEALVLSLNTVKWYVRQIFGKLGVSNRRLAAQRARELGLLGEDEPSTRLAHNLPAQLTPFLGRRQLLVDIGQSMAEPDTRLLTVVGPGGMGKTRLSIEIASLVLAERPDDFGDGIFFVPLAKLNNPTLIAGALAQAIGFQFYQADERPEQQLVHYLANKHMLLVLDNFEHLLGPESVRLVTEILTASPAIKMLATSRSRLNIQGEHLIPLAGLEIPDRQALAQEPNPVEQAMTFGGIQLFLHSARRLRPEFQLDVQNLAPIIHICSLVDGLPLGIELAAGWVAVLEPEEIATEIEGGLDILATDVANVPRRQQSLRHVFDSSWQLLTEPERLAFQTLAAFESGFDREAAQQAGQVSLITLLALINKSWLVQGASGRFQVHELLLRYGREKLARDPALEAVVLDRHSRYYCDWLIEREAGTWGAQQQVILAAIEGNLENIHAACRRAVVQGHARRLCQAANALGLFYYQWHGRYQAGQSTFRDLAEALAATETWPASASATEVLAMVRLLGWQATFCGLVGDWQGDARLIDRAQALLDDPTLAGEDTSFEQAHIAWQAGYLHLYPDPGAARQHFTQSLELFGQADHKIGLAHAQMGLGRACRGASAFEEARQALESSLELHRQLGNQHGESEALTTLGGLAIRQARFEEAETLVQQSLSITPESDRYGIAFGLGFLGSARLHTGRFAEAEAPVMQCLALHRDLGMRGYGVHWQLYLARIYLHGGNYPAARFEAEQIRSLARELDYARSIKASLALLSELALVEGAFAQAVQYLEEGPYGVRPASSAPRKYGHLALLGLAIRGLGQFVEARQHLVAALDWASTAQHFGPRMISLAGLALLAADEGQAERAVELYALAARQPYVANSRWFDDVIGQFIAAAAATLSPEVVQAARERGQARDLEATVAELLKLRID